MGAAGGGIQVASARRQLAQQPQAPVAAESVLDAEAQPPQQTLALPAPRVVVAPDGQARVEGSGKVFDEPQAAVVGRVDPEIRQAIREEVAALGYTPPNERPIVVDASANAALPGDTREPMQAREQVLDDLAAKAGAKTPDAAERFKMGARAADLGYDQGYAAKLQELADASNARKRAKGLIKAEPRKTDRTLEPTAELGVLRRQNDDGSTTYFFYANPEDQLTVQTNGKTTMRQIVAVGQAGQAQLLRAALADGPLAAGPKSVKRSAIVATPGAQVERSGVMRLVGREADRATLQAEALRLEARAARLNAQKKLDAGDVDLVEAAVATDPRQAAQILRGRDVNEIRRGLRDLAGAAITEEPRQEADTTREITPIENWDGVMAELGVDRDPDFTDMVKDAARAAVDAGHLSRDEYMEATNAARRGQREAAIEVLARADQRRAAQVPVGTQSALFSGGQPAANMGESGNDLPAQRRGERPHEAAGRPGSDGPARAGSGGQPGAYSRGQPVPGAVTATGVHYSGESRRKLNSEFYGTGLPGAERGRVDKLPAELRPRIFFYVERSSGGMPAPEAGVGAYPHRLVMGNLFEPGVSPPIQVQQQPGEDRANAFERAVAAAGYDGYIARESGVAVLLGKHEPDVEPVASESRSLPPPQPRRNRIALLSSELRVVEPRMDELREIAPSAELRSGTLSFDESEEAQVRAFLKGAQQPESSNARPTTPVAEPGRLPQEPAGARPVPGRLDAPPSSGAPTVRRSDGRTEPSPAGPSGGREQGLGASARGRVEPLPGYTVSRAVGSAWGPDPALVDVAERYAQRNGIKIERQTEYAKVDVERARRIASAYEAMPHAPQDPEVKAAYEELIRQTRAQYDALVEAGYSFWLFDGNSDPYGGNPWAAMRDLRDNKRMGVFATAAGFGSDATFNPAESPLLADTGLTWPMGSPDGEPQPVLANDLFRAVHDAFGHGLEGAGFRADGEENAWQAHVRLFTGKAVAAITTETRGQNSWLNYGPFGDANQTAGVLDTAFADQKTGLLPEWAWKDGGPAGAEPQALRSSGPRDDLFADDISPRRAAMTMNWIVETPFEARQALGLPSFRQQRWITKREFGEAVERFRKGKVEPTDYSVKARNKLATALADEVKWYLRYSKDAGIDWYTTKWQRAIDVLREEEPSLSSPSNRGLFTAVLAITSDGTEVQDNMNMAMQIYRAWLGGSKLVEVTPESGKYVPSYRKNLQILDDLIESEGIEGALEVLKAPVATADAKIEARMLGIKSSLSDYPDDAVVPRAAVYLGPKLGAFYANLMGERGYLTMDRWWNRTINRYRGYMTPSVTESSLADFADLVGAQGLEEEALIDLANAVDMERQNRFEAARERGETYRPEKYETLATTIINNARRDLKDAPQGPKDRAFQIAVARRAQELLRGSGIDAGVADIQATIWYYEKELFDKIGVKGRGRISYEEAARKWTDATRVNRLQGRGGRAGAGVAGGAAARKETGARVGDGGQAQSQQALFSDDPRRQQLRWEVTETDNGPDFANQGVQLFALGEVADLPLGQEAFVDDGARVYDYKIAVDGRFVGDASLQVKGGAIAAVHDIAIDERNRGAGTKVVESILANGSVRIIQAIDGAKAFWDRVGAGSYDIYDNSQADWQSFSRAQGARRRDSGVAGQEQVQAGRRVPAAAPRAGSQTDAQVDGDIRDLVAASGGVPQTSDTRRVEPPAGSALARLGKQTLDVFGKRVVFYESNDPAIALGGVFLPSKPDTLYVNVRREDHAGFVVGHEMLHALRRAHPDIYTNLVTLLRERAIDSRAGADRQAGVYGRAIDPDLVEEENLADVAGLVASDPQFLTDVLAALEAPQKKTFFQWVAQWFAKHFGRAKRDIGTREGINAAAADMREAIVQAYAEAVRRDRTVSSLKADAELAVMRSNGREKTITVDGVQRPTTNSLGQPIAATEDGIRNFWRWFGDSKVVDADGKPLVVYHGTNVEVSQFDPTKIGSRDAGFFGRGFYFTPNEDDASDYADTAVEDSGVGESSVVAAYIRLENPFDWNMAPNAADTTRAALGQVGIVRDSVRGDSASLGNARERDTFNRRVREAKNDGVVVRDEDGFREIVVFNPTQIKSATGNSGAFSPKEASILRSDGAKDVAPPPKKTASQMAAEIAAVAAKAAKPGTTVAQAINKAVDRVGEAVATAAGLTKVGTAAVDAVKSGIASRSSWAWVERAKQGLVADYGLPEEYLQQKIGKRLAENRQLREAKGVLDGLSGMTPGSLAVAYQWLQEKPDTTRERELFSRLTQNEQRVLRAMKRDIDKLSREAVDLGLISAETYERNQYAYVHRSYAKHEAEQTASQVAARQRAQRLKGDQFKGRGMSLDISLDRVRGDLPENLKGLKIDLYEKRDADGKLVRRDFVAAGGKPIDGYKKEGTWEIRDATRKGEATIWRDFTLAERQRMGEIEDARYGFAKTMLGGVRDVETARFLKWVSDNYSRESDAGLEVVEVKPGAFQTQTFTTEQWVKVPDTTIRGTKVKRYGDLAGRYIPGVMWNDIMGTMEMNDGLWDKLMSAWKISKTALSPGVHVNNIMSNFIMADLADVGVEDIRSALETIAKAKAGDAKAKALLERYEDSGADSGSFAANEIKVGAIEPLLEKIAKSEPEAVQKASLAQVIDLLAHGKLREGAVAGTKTLAGRALGGAIKGMVDAYQAEDSVFRLAKFVNEINAGKTDQEAGKAARDAFLNYDINAPWVRAARRSVLPFISFTYRAVPLLATAAATKPWKFGKYLALGYVLNGLAYAMLGEAGDEEPEKRLLPDEMQGKTLVGLPKMIRMPWNDGDGDPMWLDIRRWIPGGDLVDLSNSRSAVPLPQWMSVGGPLSLMIDFFSNTNFKGDKIVQGTDSPGEMIEKSADLVLKFALPNLPLPGLGSALRTVGVPVDTGNLDPYSWYNISRAAGDAKTATGDDVPLGPAVAGAFGVKVGPRSLADEIAMIDRRYQAQEREIKTDIAKIAKRGASGEIPADEAKRRIAAEVEKLVNLAKKTGEKLTPAEAD